MLIQRRPARLASAPNLRDAKIRYNEQENVAELIRRVREVMAGLGGVSKRAGLFYRAFLPEGLGFCRLVQA